MSGFDPDEALGRLVETLERHDLYGAPDLFRPAFERLEDALSVAVGRKPPMSPDGGMEEILDPFVARDGDGFLAVTVLYLPVDASADRHRSAGAKALELASTRLGPGGVVTSMDLIVHKLKEKILGALTSITGLVALTVIIIALVHFKNPLTATLALIPSAGGFLVTLSAMKFVGVDMNFMNVIVFPVILGIGVDDGIHFVHRWKEKGSGGWARALNGAGMPIVMTSLTSMVGFGSLVLADNPGLRSLGWVAILGLGACMVSTLLVLPTLCRLMEGWRRTAPTDGS
jgi:predicted RND superfamily exporter protein